MATQKEYKDFMAALRAALIESGVVFLDADPVPGAKGPAPEKYFIEKPHTASGGTQFFITKLGQAHHLIASMGDKFETNHHKTTLIRIFGQPIDWPPSLVKWAQGYRRSAAMFKGVKRTRLAKPKKVGSERNELKQDAAPSSAPEPAQQPVKPETPAEASSTIVPAAAQTPERRFGDRRQRIVDVQTQRGPNGSGLRAWFATLTTPQHHVITGGNSQFIDSNPDGVTAEPVLPLLPEIHDQPAQYPVVSLIGEVRAGTMETTVSGMMPSALLDESLPPVFGRLYESGFTSVEDLVRLMNSHPRVVLQKGAFDVGVADVNAALMHSENAYGENRLVLDLLYYRILQTVNQRRAERGLSELTAQALCDVTPAAKEDLQGDIKLRASLFINNSLLNLLDKDENRHIQTVAQLLAQSGIGRPAFTELLFEPETAYRRQEDRTIPSPALSAIAKALNTGAKNIFQIPGWAKVWLDVFGSDPDVEELLEKPVTLAPPSDATALFSASSTPSAVRSPGKTAGAVLPTGTMRDPAIVKFLSAQLRKGKLTPKNVLPYVPQLTALMNERAKRSNRWSLECNVDARQIRYVLTNVSAVFGSGATTLRILNLRILQALGEVLGKEVKPQDLWGQDCVSEPTTDENFLRARQAYDRFLPVMDDTNNLHIQTREQLVIAAGFKDVSAFYDLFSHLETAYRRDGFGEDTRPIPNKALELLSAALQCPPGRIVDRPTWEAAVRHELKARAADEEHKELAGADQIDQSAPAPAVEKPAEQSAVPSFVGDITPPEADKKPESRTIHDSEILQVLEIAARNQKLTAATLEPYATELAAWMNERAQRSDRWSEDNAVNEKEVLLALSKPHLVFSKGAITTRIINLRMVQALTELVGQEVKPEDLWGLDCAQQPTTDENIIGSRKAYDRFLRVLDQPANLHIQTMEQLVAPTGLGKLSVYNLFAGLERAYSLRAYKQDNELVPNETVQKLSEALKCTPASIVHGKTWKAMFGLNTVDAAPDVAPPSAETSATPDQLSNAASTTAQVVCFASLTPAEAPSEPVTAVAPPVVAAAAPPPPPTKDPSPDVGAQIDVKSAYRAAVLEVVKTYRSLSRTSISFLQRVEGVNLLGRQEKIENVCAGYEMDESEARAILDLTKQRLLAAAKRAGVEVTADQAIAALKVFEADEDRVTLTKYLENQSDEDIGRIFKPQVPKETVRTIRDALLNRMAETFAGAQLTQG